MLIFATLLLVLAALGGLFMVARFVRHDQTPPFAIAALHGLFAGAGLVLVAAAVVLGAGGNLARLSLAVLIVAALGGSYLLGNHVTRSKIPLSPALLHASIAVIGVALLVGAIVVAG